MSSKKTQTSEMRWLGLPAMISPVQADMWSCLLSTGWSDIWVRAKYATSDLWALKAETHSINY